MRTLLNGYLILNELIWMNWLKGQLYCLNCWEPSMNCSFEINFTTTAHLTTTIPPSHAPPSYWQYGSFIWWPCSRTWALGMRAHHRQSRHVGPHAPCNQAALLLAFLRCHSDVARYSDPGFSIPKSSKDILLPSQRTILYTMSFTKSKIILFTFSDFLLPQGVQQTC